MTSQFEVVDRGNPDRTQNRVLQPLGFGYRPNPRFDFGWNFAKTIAENHQQGVLLAFQQTDCLAFFEAFDLAFDLAFDFALFATFFEDRLIRR